MNEAEDETLGRIVALAMDLARVGNSAEIAEFLAHGFPVDAVDGEGNTLLMLAAYHGHAGAVTVLLDHGANPDLRNARDQAPIAGALFKGEDEVVTLLRAAGADLDAGTPTARQAAEMFGRVALIEE